VLQAVRKTATRQKADEQEVSGGTWFDWNTGRCCNARRIGTTAMQRHAQCQC
jgi:hypothetical protein